MSTAEPRTKPTNDYANDLTLTFEIDPAKAALVVVDMQYATGSRHVGLGKRLAAEGKSHLASERFDRIEKVVVPNIGKVLAFFREHGLRVIYVTVGSETEDYSDAPEFMRGVFSYTNNRKGHLEHEIVEELKPLPGEPVINKTTNSAFNSAGFDSLLRAMGVEHLLFTGVSTNMCVGTTARNAADRGYKCVMIEDCCGAAQNEYHRWEIVNFQRLFGRVASSDQVMDEIREKLRPVASRA